LFIYSRPTFISVGFFVDYELPKKIDGKWGTTGSVGLNNGAAGFHFVAFFTNNAGLAVHIHFSSQWKESVSISMILIPTFRWEEGVNEKKRGGGGHAIDKKKRFFTANGRTWQLKR
jgi:hypothetical protein